MTLLSRLILVLALLLQPFQGLTVQRCVGMPPAAVPAARTAEIDCSCCLTTDSDTKGARAECPFAAQQYAGCNCKEAQRDKPVPPPGERKADHVAQVLTLAPAVTWTFLSEPAIRIPALLGSVSTARPSGHAIRQLQCTWLI